MVWSLAERRISRAKVFSLGLFPIRNTLGLRNRRQTGPASLPSNHQQKEGEGNMSIFIGLFIVLLIAWLLGFAVFHVASALIHILLVVAVIALILHFVRGTTRAA
jgi:Flp pilus assembly protein TadB